MTGYRRFPFLPGTGYGFDPASHADGPEEFKQAFQNLVDGLCVRGLDNDDEAIW